MTTRFALLKAAMAVEEALRILEVDPAKLGDPAALKTAYRGASRKHHPDVPGGNVEIMKKVNEAYELLTKTTHRPGFQSPTDKAAEKAEYAAQVKNAHRVVQESLDRAFKPEVFTKHFEKVTGKTFTATTTKNLRKDFDGNPLNLSIDTEWRSADEQTVFSLKLWVGLNDVARVRMLGGEDDDENLAFSVSTVVETLHDNRKSKFKPRDWSSSSRARTVMDPEELFPAAKIKKMLGGKDKARKFSKRDMELGLEKRLGAKLETRERQTWAFIPVGEPQPQERSPGAFVESHADRFLALIYRVTMTFHGVTTATWNYMGVQGPRIPKKGREKFSADYVIAEESEAFLEALVAAQKRTVSMSDGHQIAQVFEAAFKSTKSA